MTSSLLIILGESVIDNHPNLDFNKISRELVSWDQESSNVDLNSEISTFLASNVQLINDNLFHYESEKFILDIIFNPKIKSILLLIKEFLTRSGAYRHLIFEGTVLKHSGNWLLQDGIFSYEMFAELFKSTEMGEALKGSKVLGKIVIAAVNEGEWNKANFVKLAAAISQQNKLEIILTPIPLEPLTPLANWPELQNLIKTNYPTPLNPTDLLIPSSVVGSVRFNNPTAYIFPGGCGDSCLFGVSGFTMLVDGGYGRKPCFWDFIRHLDRIDALIVTRFCPDNLMGLGSLANRVKFVEEGVVFHPEFGSFFANVPAKLTHSTNEADNGNANSLPMYNTYNEASAVIHDFSKAGLQARPCIAVKQGAVIQPTNLYHKVGHGSLDAYFLHPLADSKQFKELMVQWPKRGNAFKSLYPPNVPLFDSASVGMVAVWRPAGPNKMATRILFPSNLPQSLLFEALDRVKMVDMFRVASYFENAKVSNAIKRPDSIKIASGIKTPVKAVEELPKVEENAEIQDGSVEINGANRVQDEHVNHEIPPSEGELVKKTATTFKAKKVESPRALPSSANPRKSIAMVTPRGKEEGPATPRSATAKRASLPALGTTPKNSKVGASPVTNAFYIDLAYIPAHGVAPYVDGGFFKRVRARYYVLSALDVDASLLTGLLEAKLIWEDKDLEVTLIPTHDCEVLRYWAAAHKDRLNLAHITISPSAIRCCVQLQDHESACAAYRLEF